MKRVLILSPDYRLDYIGATAMRADHQARHLSFSCIVLLVSNYGVFEFTSGEPRILVGSSSVEFANKVLSAVRSVLFGSHYQSELFRIDDWHLPPDYFDFVIVHYPALLPLLDKIDCKSVFLDTNNNDEEYFSSTAENTTNLVKRWVIEKQGKRSVSLIEAYTFRLTASISVSESDRAWIRAIAPSMQHHIVSNNFFKFRGLNRKRQKYVLYIGSLDTEMNIRALESLIASGFISRVNCETDLEVLVAGRNPSDGLVVRLEEAGARVVANPKTLDEIYLNAAISVIPAVSGSGTKIKVFESLSYGIPVLTTRDGLVGQSSRIQSLCWVSDDYSEWLDLVNREVKTGKSLENGWIDAVKATLDSEHFTTKFDRIEEWS